MESNDKAVVIVLFSMCIMGAIVVSAVAFEGATIATELAKSGLQQCIVKVNDREEILWKKECGE